MPVRKSQEKDSAVGVSFTFSFDKKPENDYTISIALADISSVGAWKPRVCLPLDRG